MTGFDGLCPSFATRTPDCIRLRRGGSNPCLFCKSTKKACTLCTHLRFLVEMTGFEPTDALLRYPKLFARCSLRTIPTAAPTRTPFIRHRRRSRSLPYIPKSYVSLLSGTAHNILCFRVKSQCSLKLNSTLLSYSPTLSVGFMWSLVVFT